MKTLVFGSLNIDRTYRVPHLARPGETLSARSMALFCGGKGFNQAVALRRAGMDVAFSGAVGPDGGMLLEALDADGIDRSLVLTLPGSTGHAVIQVDDAGQNDIIILAGTNGGITPERIEAVLSGFSAGDLLVAQNEISHVDILLRAAAERGMTIAFNPSPMNEKIAACDLGLADYLLINETEGLALTGIAESDGILDSLRVRYPRTQVVLTLGSEGSLFMARGGAVYRTAAYPVQAVDTTAAGDTFTGYFLCAVTGGAPPDRALQFASAAAGIAVSRMGASPSIPRREEVLSALRARPAP